MQLHIRQKQDPVTLYLEGQKESYLARAAQETPFYEAYYMQCIESTVADGHEMFLLDFSRENYFRANVERLDLESGKRFFKLAGIHNNISFVWCAAEKNNWIGKKCPRQWQGCMNWTKKKGRWQISYTAVPVCIKAVLRIYLPVPQRDISSIPLR